MFRTHPGPEVGAIPARPGPILLPSVPYRIGPGRAETECTKIAHRRSLAILTADEGIAGNSAARISYTRFYRRKNRGSLAIFLRRGNGAFWDLKKSRDFSGSGKHRRHNHRESRDFGALRAETDFLATSDFSKAPGRAEGDFWVQLTVGKRGGS